MKIIVGVILLVATALSYPVTENDETPAVPLVIADYSSVAKADEKSPLVPTSIQQDAPQKPQTDEVQNDSSESDESKSAESSESGEKVEISKPVVEHDEVAKPEGKSVVSNDEVKPVTLPLEIEQKAELVAEPAPVAPSTFKRESQPEPAKTEEDEPKKVDVAVPEQTQPEKPSDPLPLVDIAKPEIPQVKSISEEKVEVVNPVQSPAVVASDAVSAPLPEEKSKQIKDNAPSAPVSEDKPAELPAQVASEPIENSPSEQKIENTNVAEEVVPEAKPVVLPEVAADGEETQEPETKADAAPQPASDASEKKAKSDESSKPEEPIVPVPQPIADVPQPKALETTPEVRAADEEVAKPEAPLADPVKADQPEETKPEEPAADKPKEETLVKDEPVKLDAPAESQPQGSS